MQNHTNVNLDFQALKAIHKAFQCFEHRRRGNVINRDQNRINTQSEKQCLQHKLQTLLSYVRLRFK